MTQDNSPFPLIEPAGDLSMLQRIYKPLTGAELARAIGSHVEKMLLNSGRIMPHLVYEQPLWQGKILVQWKAVANGQVEITLSGETEGGKDLSPEEISPESQVLVEPHHGDKDAAPDDIREVTEQPIPVLAQGGKDRQGKDIPRGVVLVRPGTFKKNKR